MKMRPFQMIVIAVFVLGALVGLYVFSNYESVSTPGEEIGVVNIWGTLPQKDVTDTLLLLADTDDRFTDVRYSEISERSFNREFADAISTGRGPDLVLISQELILSNQDRLTMIPFTSISERTYRDSYVPATEVFKTAEGFYGIPFAVDPLVLYYNTAHLDTAGYALPPTTWEAVLGQAGSLTKITTDQRIIRSSIAFGEYSNIANARALISLLLLQSGVSITAPSGSLLKSSLISDPVDTNRGSTPSEAAINFYTQFANPAKSVYSWNRSLPEASLAFIAGDLTYYVGFASEHETIAQTNPNLPFDMAAVPQPGTSVNRTSYGKSYVLALPRSAANGTGAFAIADVLSREVPINTYISLLRLAPARRDLLVAPENDPYAPIYFREALYARAWLSPTPEQTDSIFGAMISNIGSGRKDVLEAIVTADQTLNQSLR